MPTENEMRRLVSEAYPSKKWRDRVAKMSPSQIFVIYTRIFVLKRK